MKGVRILTDSASLVSKALCDELGIEVIPLALEWEGKSYLDDELEPREFFRKLKSANTLPKTSNPPPGEFKKVFDRLGAGGDSILAILIGREFSHTFEAAELAKGMSPDLDITLFNSDSHSLGLAFFVLAAARLAKEGKDAREIMSVLTRLRHTTGNIFAVMDMKFLRSGGRINHLQLIMAQTLGVVPILEIRDGPIRLLERVRSHKAVLPKLLSLVSDRVKDERPLRIGVVHADAPELATTLAEDVRKSLSPDELIVAEVGPVVATHAGPGAIGLSYSYGV
jgi:DegV family protein with EDD domain